MATKPDASHPLDKMREKFPENQISKLPKETGAQAKQRKDAQAAGNWPKKCNVCGGFHHERAVHLDYVGHAALTDRLLDTDPEWSWEPMAIGQDGLPAFDRNGGLWIKLTIHGVTRLGYGDAEGKTGGNAVKEAIGDALRNAAMRFGAALELWHKGDLHVEEQPQEVAAAETVQCISPAQESELTYLAREVGADEAKFLKWCNVPSWSAIPAVNYMDARTALEGKRPKTKMPELGDDEIPYA
jgi:hypothetical protein